MRLLELLYSWAHGARRWPWICVLVVGFVLCLLGFALRQEELGADIVDLDRRFWYTPEQVQEFVTDLGAHGRNVYAWTQLSLDLLFPAIYGTLLAVLLVCLYDRPVARWLVLLPLLTVFADWFENATTAYLAWHDGGPRGVAWFAATCTATKWSLAYLTLALLPIGASLWLWRWLRATPVSWEDVDFPAVFQHELAVIRNKRRAERLEALDGLARDGDYSTGRAQLAARVAEEEALLAHHLVEALRLAQQYYLVADDVQSGATPAEGLARLTAPAAAPAPAAPAGQRQDILLLEAHKARLERVQRSIEQWMQERVQRRPDDTAAIYEGVRTVLFAVMPVRYGDVASPDAGPDDELVTRATVAAEQAAQAERETRLVALQAAALLALNSAAEAVETADAALLLLVQVAPHGAEAHVTAAGQQAAEAAVLAARRVVEATAAAVRRTTAGGPPTAWRGSAQAAQRTAELVRYVSGLGGAFAKARPALARGVATVLEGTLKIIERLRTDNGAAAPDPEAERALAATVHSLAQALQALVPEPVAVTEEQSPAWFPLRDLVRSVTPIMWVDFALDAELLSGAVERFVASVRAAEAPPAPYVAPNAAALEASRRAAEEARTEIAWQVQQGLGDLAAVLSEEANVALLRPPQRELQSVADAEYERKVEQARERWQRHPLPPWSAEEATDLVTEAVRLAAQKARQAVRWSWSADRAAEQLLRRWIQQLEAWRHELPPDGADAATLAAERDPNVTAGDRQEQVRAAAMDLELVGLAVSGGGIRSATFALGILQGLAQLRLLKCFDYLSTVSGGGYIGSWLASWVAREQSLGNVERQLDPSRVTQARAQRGIKADETRATDPVWPLAASAVLDEEPEPLYHLRSYSRYLSPRTGLFTLDTWTLGALYLRNLLITQALLLAPLLLVILLLRLVVWCFAQPGGGDHGPANVVVAIVFVLLGLAVLVGLSVEKTWVRNVSGRLRGAVRERASALPYFLAVGLVLFALAGAWLFSADPRHGLYLRYPFYKAINQESVEQDWTPLARFFVNWFIAVAIFATGSFLWRALSRYFSPQAPAGAPGWGAREQVKAWDGLLLLSDLVYGSAVGLLLYAALDWVIWPLGQDALGLATFGPPVLLAAVVLAGYLETALLSWLFSEYEREWSSRHGALVLMWASAWLIGFAMVFYLPITLRDYQVVRGVFVAAWGAISGAGLWLGRSTAQKPTSQAGLVSVELLLSVAPPVFLIGLLAAVSLLASVLLGKMPGPTMPDLFDSLVLPQGMEPLIPLAWLMAACLVALVVLNLTVEVNRFSLHMVYANRLIRSYLGASRRKPEWRERVRGPIRETGGRQAWIWRRGASGAPTRADAQDIARQANGFTGFDPADDLPLHKLQGVAGRTDVTGATVPDAGYRGPYPLFNTALNLVAGSELAYQDRKAAAFQLSPDFCGSKRTGYAPTPCDSASAEYLTVGKAMTISGAAIDPNMSAYQSPALTALLTIFNARLGWWLENPNPRRKEGAWGALVQRWRALKSALGLSSPAAWTGQGPGAGFLLLWELLGLTDDTSQYIHLSDGGHFENLGAYELIRRRCRYVVVVDATTDRHAATDNFAQLLRLVRTDFGIRIEVDVAKLTPGPDGRTPWHCVIGLIRYDDVDARAVAGTLVYLYLSLTGDEPPDVRQYADTNPPFPYQSTVDQFFTENQFESYRTLGFHVAQEVFAEAASGVRQDALALTADRDEIRQLFARVRRQWFPAPPEFDQQSQNTTRLGIDLGKDLRTTPNLDALRDSLYPEVKGQATAQVEMNMVNEVLKVMQAAWQGMRLDEFYAHPLNRGWMNVFRRATAAVAFRRYWPFLRAEYSADFVRFCERALNLAPTEVICLRPRSRAELSRWLASVADMDQEFLQEWASERKAFPWLTTGRYLADRILAGPTPPARPWVWLLFLNEDRPGTIYRPCGLACASPPYRGEKDDLEFFLWLRGPYRNLGIGREAIQYILPRLNQEIRDERPAAANRLLTYYPASGSSRAERLHKALWMNFFFDYGFRSLRSFDKGRLAGIITLARELPR